MDNFGGLVKQLRERRGLGGRQMARIALGEDATADDIAYYADQLSKLEGERPGNTNPGLQRIWAVARGFGFDNLDEFFAELRRVPDLFNNHIRKDLPPSPTKPENPGSLSKGTHGDQIPATDHEITDAIHLLGDDLVNALNRLNTTFGSIERQLVALFDHLVADRQQGAGGRAKSSRQRTRPAAGNRKTG